MQASGLAAPSGGADIGIVRNPGGAQQGTQNAQGAQTSQGAQGAQTAQGTQAPASSNDAQLSGAQVLQQAGASLQEAMQGAQRPAAPTAGQPLAAGQQTAQLPGQAAELSGDLPELPVLDAAPRQDGNFQAFLQKLADTPSFAEGMNKLLLELEPKTEAALPEELGDLLKMLPQDETQTAALVKEQVTGGTRFTGELFSQLRDAYAQSPSKAAKSDILQFLRRFNDYTSAPRVEHSLVRTLGQLAKAVPRETGGELEQLAKELEQHFETGDRSGALKLLQGKALPFLTDFADHHPDMRLPNTLISIFKPLASRYEGGGEEGLLQSFRQLAEHDALRPYLGHLNASQLLQMVKDSDYAKAEENSRFAEQLAKTADWAMKGKGGGEPRKIFRQLVSNLLLNKSVYLPLEHAVIPMEWNGKRVVSELWVDPNAEQDAQAGEEKDRLIRFLLHLDVPGLGPFDIVFASRGETVDMQVACPKTVVPFAQVIQKELSRILDDNGLKMNGLQVRKWEKPLTLAEAFPKLKRADTSVNMKV